MGLKQGESPMKYYKEKAKSSPMKIPAALIAKLAPVALNAISSMGIKGGGEKEEQPQQEEPKKKIIGLS